MEILQYIDKEHTGKVLEFRNAVEEFFLSVNPIRIADIFEVQKKVNCMLKKGTGLTNPIPELLIAEGFEKYINWVDNQILLAVALPNTKEQIDKNDLQPGDESERPPLISAIFCNGNKGLIKVGIEYEIIKDYKGNWIDTLEKAGEYINFLHKTFQYPVKLPPLKEFLDSVESYQRSRERA